jgi:hypothetical protein
MFRTSIAGRTARALAAGALIVSLGATTFAGSAYAAPLAENDCSAAAHARNDAVHLLHTAWKAFAGDLKDLARDARKLQHESHKKGDVVVNDARAVVASAKSELKDIRSQAQEDIQAVVELGTACSDEDDSKSSTDTTKTTNTNNTSTTAPRDATAPADTTGSAHTFDTSGLDAKYKGIVDKAIKDMQKVVDDARHALLDITAVADEAKDAKDANDDSKVKKDVETAKADREKAKADREDAKKSDNAKAKSKSTTKAQNSGKGKVHDRATSHRDEND